MLRRPVEQPQGLGPRGGAELARRRPHRDPRVPRPEPQLPPPGVARDLELARDTFGAPSSPVQLADLANHLGVDHRHLRSRWCHARRLCRHVSSSLGPREEGSDLDSDGGHYCDRPTASIHRSPMWSWRGPARHCVRPRGGPVGQWMCRDTASGMTYACTYIYVTIGSDITVGRIVRDAHAI